MQAQGYTRVKVCRVFDENRRVEALSERSAEVQTKLLVQCLCDEGVNNSLHGVTPLSQRDYTAVYNVAEVLSFPARRVLVTQERFPVTWC